MKLLTNRSVVGTNAAVGLTVGTDIVKVGGYWIACGVVLVKELAVLLAYVVATIWEGEKAGDLVGVNHDQVEVSGFCN